MNTKCQWDTYFEEQNFQIIAFTPSYTTQSQAKVVH